MRLRYVGQEDGKNGDHERPMACFRLGIDILSELHVNHILGNSSPDFKPEVVPKVDVALASTISTIGSENGQRIYMWSKRNLMVATAVIDGVLGKLVALAPTFVERKVHPGQLNSLAILGVCRNLTWCPLFEEAESIDASQSLLKSHLLLGSSNLNIGATKAVCLLPESTCTLIRSLLSQLSFVNFDLVSETEKFVHTVKGAGIAFTLYFHDCWSCFQIPALAEQQKMLGLVYNAYRFDCVYSQEEEERLRLIIERDTLNIHSIGKKGTAEEVMHTHDLEVLNAGTSVEYPPSVIS